MKRIIYYISLYLAFAKSFVHSYSQYPLDTFLTALGLFIRELSTFAGILTIAFVAGDLGGLNVWELCMLFAFTAISEALSTLFLSTIWDIGFYVQKGTFDVMLTRPASVLFQLVCRRIHYPALLSFFLPFGLLLYSIYKCGLAVTPGLIFFLVECIFCGMLLNSSVYLTASSLNFWIVRGNIADILEAFREFARYPIHIFPAAIQFTLTAIIPFGFIGYYPVLYLCGYTQKNIPLLLLSITLAAMLIGILVFKRGLASYNSTGT